MSNATTSVILIVLGFVPSISWLGFYLKKDIHPEPKYLISRTFLMGIIIAPLAVAAQWSFRTIMPFVFPALGTGSSALFFLWAAFIEEIVKFLAVRFMVLNNPAFDEPIDAMEYMIAAGVGFAAIENILVLFQTIPSGFSSAINVWVLRFVGATLLHAVSSALLGYFLALSWFYKKHSSKLIVLGIIVATGFHFAFNIILLGYQGRIEGFYYSTIFLIFAALVVSYIFKRLKSSRTNSQTIINSPTP